MKETCRTTGKKDTIVEALVAQRFQVRKAAQTGEDGALLRAMVHQVFVEECGFRKGTAADSWDAVSQYYLATVDGVPAGCARLVDPLAFPEAAKTLPHSGARCRFAMEEDFPLESVLPDPEGYVETGRFVLLPAYRGGGGLSALIATAVLYARHRGRRGNIGIGVARVTATYEKLGWRPLGECFQPKTYATTLQAMIVRPEELTAQWSERIAQMEMHGVIEV